MSQRIVGAAVITLLVVCVFVMGAFAAVAFDPATGSGFVGNGDVQTAFGWNQSTLQANAGNLTFSYNSARRAFQDCEISNGLPHRQITVDVTLTGARPVHPVIQYDTHAPGQVDGFNLVGYDGDASWTGQMPTCPDGATPVGEVYYTAESGTRLDVDYNGAGVSIWAPSR